MILTSFCRSGEVAPSLCFLVWTLRGLWWGHMYCWRMAWLITAGGCRANGSLLAKSGRRSFETLPASLVMSHGNCISRVAVNDLLQSGSSLFTCGVHSYATWRCLWVSRSAEQLRPRPQALLAGAVQCQESLAFTTPQVTCPGKHAVMILLMMSLGSGGFETEEGFLPHHWIWWHGHLFSTVTQ